MSSFCLFQDLSCMGIDIDYADRYMEQCYPQSAAWIGDMPEQSLLTTIMGGYCPIFKVPKVGRKNLSEIWVQRYVSSSRKGERVNIMPLANDKFLVINIPLQADRTLTTDKPLNKSDTDCSCEEHYEGLYMERLWPGLDQYRIVALDVLHKLNLGLFKSYLIPWTMQHLK